MSNQSTTIGQNSQPATTDGTTEPATDRTGDDATGSGPTQPAVEERSDDDPETLPLDEVFDALRNSRRRQVIRYLRSHEGPATTGDLSEHVAAIENDTTVQALSSQQRKRVYVGLYQCHLPKLDDLGVVAFDRDRGKVELGQKAAQLDRYLFEAEDGEAEDRPWHHHYLGFLAISAGALTLGAASGLVGVAAAGVVFATIALGLGGLAALVATRED